MAAAQLVGLLELEHRSNRSHWSQHYYVLRNRLDAAEPGSAGRRGNS